MVTMVVRPVVRRDADAFDRFRLTDAGQFQKLRRIDRTVDHDRGEGIPDDPCGGGLIERLSPAESSTIIPHQASGKTHAAR